MPDGRIDGRFIITADLSTGIKDELGLTDNDCKNMGSVWNEIVEEASTSLQNNNVSQTSSTGALVEIIPSIWQKIVNTVNQTLSKNIQIEEPDEFYDNINLGNSEILKYNQKYPDKKSDTLLYYITRYFEKYGNNENKLNTLKKNPAYSTLVAYLEKYRDTRNFQELQREASEAYSHSDEYDEICSHLRDFEATDLYNKLPLHNCGDRAEIIKNNFEEHGIKCTTVEISDLKNFKKGDHKFCVIGMDDNADKTDPDTWGKNAVIVDAWAGRSFSVQEGIAFYREFFMLDN